MARQNKVIKSKATKVLAHVVRAKFNMAAKIPKKASEQIPKKTKDRAAEIKSKLDADEKMIQQIISAGPNVELAEYDNERVMKLCGEANEMHQQLLTFSAGIIGSF